MGVYGKFFLYLALTVVIQLIFHFITGKPLEIADLAVTLAGCGLLEALQAKEMARK